MKSVAMTLSALIVCAGGGFTVWHLYDQARFERGRQQFLAATADLVPAKPDKPERYMFIDKAIND